MALYSYKNFVRAAGKDILPSDAKAKKKNNEGTNDGDEVRGFYESLVGLNDSKTKEIKSEKCDEVPMPGPSTSISDIQIKGLKKRKTEQQRCATSTKFVRSSGSSLKLLDKPLSVKDLLHAAQDGDLKKVKNCLEDGVDINAQDHYGWTALMCAVQEGQIEIVKHLLWQECNMFLTDSKGISALDLAKRRRKNELIKILVDHANGVTYREKALGVEESDAAHSRKSGPKYPKFYCEVCKKQFEDCSRESHDTSTLHLFNMKLPTKSDQYLIPQNNKGYQMLVKSGWDEDGGLGHEGQGQKFPVKTVLKRDRKGLGLDAKAKSKARITHFMPNDTKAIKSVKNPSIRKEKAATLSKRARVKKLSKERQFEKKYRMEFHTPF